MLLLRNKEHHQSNALRKFRNVLSLQTKEWTWVNCKLITASH